MNMQASTPDRIAALESKLDAISAQLQQLVDAQRPFAELAREMGPIASEVMSTGIEQCAFLEERGYFDFVRELKYLVDRIVEDYNPRDLHELADNAANILDTVRTVTQPAIMAAVRDAADAFDDHKRAPVGVFGAYRSIRKDKNIQRGLAFTLDVLGRVGRAVARAPRLSRSELRALPGGAIRPTIVREPKSEPSPATSKPVALEAGCAIPDPTAFVPDSQWNREVATERALSLGLAELSDAHWQLVQLVREAYQKSNATPNIRKLTSLAGTSTREIYALFPKAPGLTIAAIAGVPKPVGCL